MPETFKPGSVVQLKSKTTPAMVVTRSWEADNTKIELCECHWFNFGVPNATVYEHKTAEIPASALELAKT